MTEKQKAYDRGARSVFLCSGVMFTFGLMVAFGPGGLFIGLGTMGLLAIAADRVALTIKKIASGAI